jgi:ethanolamine permease
VASPTVPAKKLGVLQIAALGVSLVIAGQFTGWNFGLPVGGLGGMVTAVFLVLAMYFGLTQCVLELSTGMPGAAGAHAYGGRAFGPLVGFLAGATVLFALTVGCGVVANFIAAYAVAVFGIDPWVCKVGLFAGVIAVHLRGGGEASGFTTLTSLIAALALLVFGALMVPHVRADNLYEGGAAGPHSLFPAGLAGVFACIPYSVWMFLAIENTALAVEEAKDPLRTLPQGMNVGLLTVAATGLIVLILGTAGAGVDAIKTADDPLYAAMVSRGVRSVWSARVIGMGAISGLLACFFSLVYAASRQLFAMGRDGELPQVMASIDGRGTPRLAVLAVGVAAFIISAAPTAHLLVPIVLLFDLSYVLIAAAYLRIRRRSLLSERRYRAIGGAATGWTTLLLTATILMACLQIDRATIGTLIIFYAVVSGAFTLARQRRSPS